MDNTKWTYIILYTYFIYNEDMKKTNKQKPKMLSVMHMDYQN
jgi:hypothetical protein